MAAKGKKADYHLRLVQIKLRKNVYMQIPMDKMCKHQQLFDSRDAPLGTYEVEASTRPGYVAHAAR